MADYQLNALHKAPLRDTSGVQLNGNYTVTSSDTSVVSISSPNYWAIGVGAGTADVTVVRKLDGATVTHSVEVLAADPFDWSLGTEQLAL